MEVKQISSKHVAISKANAQMVFIVAVGAFVTIFCLMASKAVLSENRYESRVIKAQTTAHKQLQDNISTYNDLSQSYDDFDSASTNVIGGKKDGNGPNDGSNSTIILHALPDTYDFPALTSSIEKILSGSGLRVTSITGTDEQLTQQNNGSSTDPQAVNMPFGFTVSNASYASVKSVITKLQLSIRPIQIDTLDISGNVNNMTLTVTAHTYYQPAKKVSITKEAVQ